MRRRYILAIAAQVFTYAAVAVWIVFAIGIVFQFGTGLLIVTFIAFGMLGGLVATMTLFLNCERCGEDYFYRGGPEDSDNMWIALHAARTNIYWPVKANCQLCGLERRVSSDRDPV